jgi:hypothetical protein
MDGLSKIYNQFSECGKTNLYFIAIATYIIMIFFFMTNNPDVLYSKQYFYLSIFFLPLAAVGLWGYNNFVKNKNASISKSEIMFSISAIILVVVGIFLYISNDISILEIKSAFVFFRFIEALIILVILAIFFRTTVKNIDTTDASGWSGFFIQLIFYIPCLIGDFIEYLLGEFRSTPNVVFSLFIIEIFLILLYIYFPKLASASIMKNGVVLVKEPTPINMKKPLKTYIDLTNTETSKSNKLLENPLLIKNKFSLSGWVYVVSQPPNKYPYNDEATIFEFTTLHPRLVFNGKTNKFKAYFNETQTHEFEMPLQKWNYVVFNYDKSNIDLFVNGTLNHSVKRNINDDNFKINDLVYIGQERGLSGGVCNLMYSTTPLIGQDIKYNYDYNKYNNPPL